MFSLIEKYFYSRTKCALVLGGGVDNSQQGVPEVEIDDTVQKFVYEVLDLSTRKHFKRCFVL